MPTAQRTFASFQSLAAVMGCSWLVDAAGMLIPPGFKNFCAPSRHSGDNSLSPNDPSSSLTRMSACSGASHERMSDATIVTRSCHLHGLLTQGLGGYVQAIWLTEFIISGLIPGVLL